MANLTFMEGGYNVDFTPALKTTAEKKLKKVNANLSISIVKEGYNFKVQVNGDFSASAVNKDAYAGISEVADKIEGQARKLRERQNDKTGKTGFKGEMQKQLEQEDK